MKKWNWIRIASIFLLLVLAAAMSFYCYQFTMVPRYMENKYEIPNDQPVGEIVQGVVIEQTFHSLLPVDGIGLFMATYTRLLTNDFTVEVRDLTHDEVLYLQTVPASSIADNSTHVFMFSKGTASGADSDLRITLTSQTALNGDALTVWASDKDVFAEGALTVNGIQQPGDLVFETFTKDSTYNPVGLLLNRLMILLLLFAFLLLHLLLDVRRMYDWIFRKRVWVALGLILFLVLNKFNFSSIGMFDSIQPGQGSEYVQTIFGIPRGIRSDEWLVTTPSMLSAQYSGYSQFNDVLRAARYSNLSSTGLSLGFSALAEPLKWGYYLFGSEYGLSLNWAGFLVLTFLFSFELCLIFSKRNRWVALLGAVLITFSGYFQWWSYVNWILTGQAALVFIYYFLHADRRWARALSGIAFAIAGAGFVVVLYPAWQVPAGYLYLGILIWMLVDGRERFRDFDRYDWMILSGALLFMASIILVRFYENRQYMADIMNTTYPGQRVSNGGFSLDKLFYYVQVLFYPFKELANPSRAGVFLSFYPIPTILAVWLMIQRKGKDLLTAILLGVSILLTFYCVVPLPALLAKTLLLTFSTPIRLIDIIGLIQVYLLVVSLSRFEGARKLPTAAGWILGILTVEAAIYFCQSAFPDYLSPFLWGVVAVVFIITCALLLIEAGSRVKKYLFFGIILVSLISGLCVNPLVKGLDAIYGKPVSKEIADIVAENPEGKWISLGNIVDSGFLVANGAPTINSVNFVPNWALWRILDSDGRYESLYNRYAHMSIDLVFEPTSVVLQGVDSIGLFLNYYDLERIGVDYIFSRTPVQDAGSVAFEKLYEACGVYIYKIRTMP